jgi:hypothetical protein
VNKFSALLPQKAASGPCFSAKNRQKKAIVHPARWFPVKTSNGLSFGFLRFGRRFLALEITRATFSFFHFVVL